VNLTVTNENITVRVQEFLPLAVFVFFLSYVAFEASHLIHSPGWEWKRTAKGCLEALAFVVLSMPFVAGVYFLASHFGERFNLDTREEAVVGRFLSMIVVIPLLIIWNGRRWKRMSKAKSPEHTPSP
jgi:hypothetical protein